MNGPKDELDNSTFFNYFFPVHLVQSRPADGTIDEFGRVMNKAFADVFNKENFDQVVQKGSELADFARKHLADDQNSLERQVNALNSGECNTSLKIYLMLLLPIVLAAVM